MKSIMSTQILAGLNWQDPYGKQENIFRKNIVNIKNLLQKNISVGFISWLSLHV